MLEKYVHLLALKSWVRILTLPVCVGRAGEGTGGGRLWCYLNHFLDLKEFMSH